MRALLARLRRDERGATMLEFALIAPVFMLLIMGMLDLAQSQYIKTVLAGAVEKAGRDSMLQTGPSNAATIDAAVWQRVRPAVPTGSLSTTRRAYQDFGTAGKPEDFVDGNSNSTRDTGECFQDVNGDGVWSVDSSTDGQGGAGDAVLYTATVSYPHFFPMPSLLAMFPGAGQPAMSTTATSTAITVLRNQPYALDQQPLIICS